MSRHFTSLALGLVASLALMHCGSDPLETVGTWTSSFGGTETITDTAWASTPIVEYDNAKNAAYLQNPATAMFGPNKFLKYVWTEPAG